MKDDTMYRSYHLWEEIIWAAVTAALTFLVANLQNVTPEQWAEPAKLWTAFGAGLARAVLGAVLWAIQRQRGDQTPPTPLR